MASPSFPAAPRQAEDWTIGDLAECVPPERSVWCLSGTGEKEPGPAIGQVLMVDETCVGPDGNGGTTLYLVFNRFWPRVYDAANFRKITPRADDLVAAESQIVERWLPRKVGARMAQVAAALGTVTFALVIAPAIATAWQVL